MNTAQFFGIILIVGAAVAVSMSVKPLRFPKIKMLALGSILAFVGALIVF